MDSPGSGTSSPHRRSNNVQPFSLEEASEEPAANGQRGHGPLSRHEDDVFDLSMDYDEDDQVLLDWEQYAGLKRTRCCGMDCTRLANRLPGASSFPPAWWYQLSRQQKKLFWYITAGFSAFIIILASALSSSGGHHRPSASGVSQAYLSQYPTCQWDQWRLPNSTRPTAYDLSLIVDLEEPYTVVGNVRIHLNMSEAAPCVVLHSSGMTVANIRLEGGSTAGESILRNASALLTLNAVVLLTKCLPLHSITTLRHSASLFSPAHVHDLAHTI